MGDLPCPITPRLVFFNRNMAAGAEIARMGFDSRASGV
ncbi:hypothetical protein SCH4B_1100 [Ruegeria sp. TrichCH4B]|nr:hypothetical protein SCH4B_1100 [Ruegeria sp. TrichCH4B]